LIVQQRLSPRSADRGFELMYSRVAGRLSQTRTLLCLRDDKFLTVIVKVTLWPVLILVGLAVLLRLSGDTTFVVARLVAPPGFGLMLLVVTRAVLVPVPTVSAYEATVIVTRWPLASVPRAQVTSSPWLTEQWPTLVCTETTVIGALGVS
jgi:hypothetical protein